MKNKIFFQYFMNAHYFIGFFSFQYKEIKSCHRVTIVFIIFNCVHASKMQVKINLFHMRNDEDANNTVKHCKFDILIVAEIDEKDSPWWAHNNNDNIFCRSFAIGPHVEEN